MSICKTTFSKIVPITGKQISGSKFDNSIHRFHLYGSSRLSIPSIRSVWCRYTPENGSSLVTTSPKLLTTFCPKIINFAFQMPFIKLSIRQLFGYSSSKRQLLTIILTWIRTTNISRLFLQMRYASGKGCTIRCNIWIINFPPLFGCGFSNLKSIIRTFYTLRIQPCHVYPTVCALHFHIFIFPINTKLPIFFKEILILHLYLCRGIIGIECPF